jgi:hypothetical protein
MSRLISFTERVAIPVGGDFPMERVVKAHVARGFHGSGDALVRGTRIGSYLRGDPSKWRTTAVILAERNVLTVTWTVDVSGQTLFGGEVDVLRKELQWAISERASDAVTPPDFAYDTGDTLVAIARKSPARALIVLLAGLFAAGLGITSLVREDVPHYDLLELATGEVEWTKEQQHAVRFALRGDARVYVYHSKAGPLGPVGRSLKSAKASTVSVHYSPVPHTAVFGGAGYEVWDIVIDGRPLRTYAEIMRSRRTDNIIGVYLGAAFLFVIMVLAWMGARALRRQRRRLSA